MAALPHSHSKHDFLEILEQRISENKATHHQPTGLVYRFIAEKLGVAPWKVIIPLSLAFGFGLVAVLGDRAIRGVSLLQWGF